MLRIFCLNSSPILCRKQLNWIFVSIRSACQVSGTTILQPIAQRLEDRRGVSTAFLIWKNKVESLFDNFMFDNFIFMHSIFRLSHLAERTALLTILKHFPRLSNFGFHTSHYNKDDETTRMIDYYMQINLAGRTLVESVPGQIIPAIPLSLWPTIIGRASCKRLKYPILRLEYDGLYYLLRNAIGPVLAASRKNVVQSKSLNHPISIRSTRCRKRKWNKS